MNLDAFDFNLPDENIALRPVEPRDACRLLVCQNGDPVQDRVFSELTDILKPGDLLIANDTQVIPALLFGLRLRRDERSQDIDVQVNLLEKATDMSWKCLVRPGRRFREGDIISFQGILTARVTDKLRSGEVMLTFEGEESGFWTGLRQIGGMPIPPYIAKNRASDQLDHQDYQTVFAQKEGSVAAPTAGLHFTDRLIASLKDSQIDIRFVTLHVGAGTFSSLTEDAFRTGRLHMEWCEVSHDVADQIALTKRNGGRVIAVGTTALRTLEGRSTPGGELRSGSGPTDIFIQPGYQFRIVDGLITNFHLPRSSLFVLISALMGTQKMQKAYNHAIQSGYRFYSYGDACLLIP